MPTLTSIFLLLTATLLLCIIPGPDMLYIIARSTSQGRSAGVISCVGIACCRLRLLHWDSLVSFSSYLSRMKSLNTRVLRI